MRKAALLSLMPSAIALSQMYTNGINKPIAANRFARHGMRKTGFLSSDKSVIYNAPTSLPSSITFIIIIIYHLTTSKLTYLHYA